MSDDGMTVEVRTTAFEGALQRMQRGVRDGFIDPKFGTLMVQGRLLAEKCQEFTPPRNEAQGRAAVARDISVIFRPLTPFTWNSPSIRRVVREGDRAGWDKLSTRLNGPLKGTRAIPFSVEWHTANKISRGRGRRGKGGNIGVVTLWQEGTKARDYMGKVQKRVGWAKAGWNSGIIGLGGGGFGGGGKNMQPWVSRHGLGGGFHVNGTASPDPFVQVGNTTKWARYGSMGEANRILRNAIGARIRDMETYYNRMMKLAADKAQQPLAA